MLWVSDLDLSSLNLSRAVLGSSYVLRLFLAAQCVQLFSCVLLRSNEANAWPNAEWN